MQDSGIHAELNLTYQHLGIPKTIIVRYIQ
jgi:hypothetical protein